MASLLRRLGVDAQPLRIQQPLGMLGVVDADQLGASIGANPNHQCVVTAALEVEPGAAARQPRDLETVRRLVERVGKCVGEEGSAAAVSAGSRLG
jgi:hypothetical protein